MKDFEVYSVKKPTKSRKYETHIIGFSNDNYAWVSLQHTDALLLSLAIANHKIHRILIDTGSSADILCKSAFKLMNIDRSKVIPTRHSLAGFSGEQVMVKFLIIDWISAYNAILGRTALNDLKDAPPEHEIPNWRSRCRKRRSEDGPGMLQHELEKVPRTR
jgi:hypothetical protein